MLKSFEVDCRRVQPHRIGVIYHLIKTGDASEGTTCFASACQGGTDLAKRARYAFGKARFAYEATVRAVAELRGLSGAVAQFVVGLDAASREIGTDPWVFAPAYRLARELTLRPRKGLTIDGKRDNPVLGLTYHVGEDYAHLLSGLRHIYEAVDFFKLHAGDRLGHAIALGADVEPWMTRRRLGSLPIQEWIENYLWAWKVSLSAPTKLSQHTKRLEASILLLAQEIYGTLDGLTVDKLYKAYVDKAMDYEHIQRIGQEVIHQARGAGCPKTWGWGDCFEDGGVAEYFPCLSHRENSNPGHNWTVRELTMSHHCAFFKYRMNREIVRELSVEDAELIRELQIMVRQMVAQNGIIVETNPSSNVLIGDLNGMLGHHILSLRKHEGEPPVMASINTDDPSVFATTVANEHANIYHALIHAGYTREIAANMVDNIRQTGMDTSFIKGEISLANVLSDYEEILRCL